MALAPESPWPSGAQNEWAEYDGDRTNGRFVGFSGERFFTVPNALGHLSHGA